MTSLLPVCLGLLLVCCVHGQPWLNSSELLSRRCRSDEEQKQFVDCYAQFLTRLGIQDADYDKLNRTFICGHVQAWVDHTACVNAILRVCQAAHQDLIVSEDSMRQSQQYWCDHSNHIRLDCVKAYPGYQLCYMNATNRYDVEASDSGLTDRVCSYLNLEDTCYRSVGNSCGGHDVRIFSTYWKMTYPPACASATLLLPSSFLLLGACAVLLSKMAVIF